MRAPLPRWKRILMPGAFALDYLDLLFRYRPFDAAKDLDPKQEGYLANVLEHSRIFIPFASTFNDPWEAAPRIEPPPWTRDRVAAFGEFLAFLASQDAQEVTRELRRLPLEAVQDRMQQMLLARLQRTPILSLCDRADNFLMWSYYAKGHFGYSLVFDARRLPAAGAYRVRYSRRHPTLLTSIRDRTGIAAAVLATKARQWKHEGEWRVITSPAGDPRMGLQDVAERTHGILATIPADAIVGVIVGDHLNHSAAREETLTLLYQYRKRIRAWVAEIDRRSYRIVLRPVAFTD